VTTAELVAELQEHHVYMLTVEGQWSLIGEYAGIDDEGQLVFAVGPLSPMHIPAQKIAEWTRLT